MSRPRVLVVCAEPVGERMAGPAIRSLELARTLALRCDVTLAAPPPSAPGAADVELLPAGLRDFDTLVEAARSHDVVVAERLPPQLLRAVAALPARYVADLYNPTPVEVMEAVRAAPERSQRRRRRIVAAAAVANCAVADFMICASERQRDFWLGLLASHGLIDLERYSGDPGFRSVIDVVPFGIPAEPPRPGSDPPLKAALPGVGAEDQLLLWGGGIWNWLDPLTPIRAVERLRSRRPAVHLLFAGVERPGALAADELSAARAAREEARRLGLEGSRVHFSGWLPYDRRHEYLLGSDLGVSAHSDHLEARLSFRTRVLDYLWAGLPVVATRGDSLSELVEREGLGRAVDPHDDEAFAEACLELLDDGPARSSAVEALRRVAPSFVWERAAEPLLRFCLEYERRPPRPAPGLLLARATLGEYPRLLARAHEEHGPVEVVRKLGRNLARAVRRA